MSRWSRRDFLRTASLGAGGSLVFGPTAASARIAPGLDWQDRGRGWTSFEHGVASGDPLQDSVIIWTRLTVDERAPGLRRRWIPVGWTVAEDPDFRHLVRRGVARTSALRDWTLKVDLKGLDPGQTYYYRFNTLTARSPVGVTRTLPVFGVERVKLAVFSCSNYPAGYFNAYQDAARIPDLDAVCHLGDYIYEYGEGGYATEGAEARGRRFLPGNDQELLSLQDYRTRYAQYRSDPGLQALHAACPFICVWDDHEVANDAWRDGAENHQPDEGSWADRKRAALRAYFEWLPVRPPEPGNLEKIYRAFNFGGLVDLLMLDTRLIGRDQQLDYLDYFLPDGSFNAGAFLADIGDPNRTLLGADQLGWLQARLLHSTATWSVLGQQVLIGRMNVPAELLAGLANPGPELLTQLQELAVIKQRILLGDPTVTAAEAGRLENPLPYNLDAWDGYPYEREIVFGTARAGNRDLLVLAGDTHNAWANNLRDANGNPVGVEFATTSVTSPGLEAVLGIPSAQAQGAEQVLQLLIDDLQYANVTDRGYLTVTFTPDAATAEWVYVDNIDSPEYSALPARGRRLQVRNGVREIEEV